MKRTIRVTALAMGLALLGVPWAAQAGQGNAVIRSKQVEENVVVLDDKRFRVQPGTVLEDADGNRVAFRALPSTADGASDDAAAVWYESSAGNTRVPVLHLLRLTGGLPR